MRGITVNHSKTKNTGILFEILVRQITSDTLEGRSDSVALNLLQKYFNTNRELGRELQLYQAVFNAPRLNESRALQYLDMLIKQRKKLDERKLAVEKYEFIKEVKQHYNLEEFLSCKIPSYKLHASIYKTFVTEARYGGDSIMNIQDVASARFTLIEHFIGTGRKTSKKDELVLIEEFKNQTEDLRLLTYKIMIDRFNEKYEDLNDKQKSLLREYINDVSGTNTLMNYIASEVPALCHSIQKKSHRLTDRVMQIKINEVVSQLSNIGKNRGVKDNEITALMIGYQIDKELNNE
jgi:hypothetical protein